MKQSIILRTLLTKAQCLLLLFVVLQNSLPAFGQKTLFPINEWAKKLNSKDDVENSELRNISWNILRHYDSTTVADCIKQLENTGEPGAYFKAKITFLKAADVYYRGGDITLLTKLCEQSLFEAYETYDNYLIGYMSFFYGLVMESRSELTLSTFFYLNADEMYPDLSKLGQQVKFG